MNIYVASIPFKANDEDLRKLFEEHGEVQSAKIIIDKASQRSRGFGFVEMNDESEARQAITALNGAEYMGKTLIVNEARPKPERSFNNRDGNRRSFRNY